MAPTSSTDSAPVKHMTLHHFLKQQLLQQHRLKPAVMWGWPAAAAATIGRHAPEDAVDDDDGLGGAWPPRSYTCAFCRREFRSAQALGGHMNVHRRDRAKMRGGHHGSAVAQPQLGSGEASATDETPPAAAVTKYAAVLYPILNSNAAGAVLIPSGDVLLSAPVELAPSHDQCHVSDDEEDGKDVDLELRLWWP
ncbi:hypothetical protein BAE44_0014173 [Dichanthelium oligosanthes]|uniref:C2H2-type domain-containing protein n=1 Tax=Dichanthelium oligosanthes TaxID=888268 RepID=A0A1E5VI67_9POAL|nr:hypothetical protein BAE44_0014173 [Dichanthelium oligosanthes]